jgi:phage terminase large subunit-like protein
METNKLADELIGLDREERKRELAKLSEEERKALLPYWRVWAHPGQSPPVAPWHTWVIMAGRGYGKTRAGAEWVRAIAEADPTARVALIGDSLGEARRVMVEGPSGLLAIARPEWRPAFEPSKRQLTWPNGAVATLYSAGEPESLRGPQHSHARRAVAEGILRQRGACVDRRPASCSLRGRSGRPAGDTGRR